MASPVPLQRERLFSVKEIVGATRGRLVQGSPETAVSSVVLDNRQVAPGALFVAIIGERVDGHRFAGPAVAAGAAAVLVSQWPLEGLGGGAAVIQVTDTVTALGDLAAYHRKKFRFRAVGITGSVGKTTTKDLTAAVLAGRFTTLSSEGNLNSDLGLPLVMFRARPEHEVAVFEMAMRGPGQIKQLCDIVHPEVGVLTNIGQTHIELLGSVEAIADTKAELIESLPDGGVAVLNANDPWMPRIAKRAPGRVVYYGTGPGAVAEPEVRGEDAVSLGERGIALTIATAEGKARCTIPIPGLHNIPNALAAATVGTVFGLSLEDIARSLEQVVLSAMRVHVERVGAITVIDDTYNASPASTLAALAVLDEVGQGGRRIFVFADMLELGAIAAEGHAEVGRDVARRRPDLFLTVGDLAAGAAEAAVKAGYPAGRVVSRGGNGEIISALGVLLRDGDTVLVKGSRGMALEEVVSALTGREGPSH